MDGHFFAGGSKLQTTHIGLVLWCNRIGLRVCEGGDGPLLLSPGPKGLFGYELLPGPRATLSCLRRRKQGVSIFASLCDRPRGRSPRAKSARIAAEGQGGSTADGSG